MSSVVVTVKPDGTATVEAEGVKGSTCALHTRPFINALGRQQAETPKPEMFEEVRLRQEHTQ